MSSSLIANHLWQSTIFSAVAWVLSQMLLKNRARVRYWIWVLASLKFLIPFSLLVTLGNQFSWPSQPHIAMVEVPFVQSIGEPFSAPPLAEGDVAITGSSTLPLNEIAWAIWAAGVVAVLFYWLMQARRVSGILRAARMLENGREVEALNRVKAQQAVSSVVRCASSESVIEPGIYGTFRPVLFLPVGLALRLNDAQLDAIFAHEICHIRKRDNLFAVIHMTVETLFWFHPFVWAIGSRLIHERERSCDEDVLSRGGDPKVYAGAILKVCEYYVACPASSVAGVTGANLKERIRMIMDQRTGRPLDVSRKILLGSVGFAVVAGPIIVGVLDAPLIQAHLRVAQQNESAVAGATSLEFDAASLKPANGDSPFRGGRCTGTDSNFGGSVLPQAPPALGTCRYQKATLNMLLNVAFVGMRSDVQIIGGPSWASTLEFDLLAKAESPASTTVQQLRRMMQTFLEDRFQLRFHRETRSIAGYALLLAKSGPKLRAPSSQDQPVIGGVTANAHSTPPLDMPNLLKFLSGIVKEPVVDQSGITGSHDFSLTNPEGSPLFNDPQGPSIFSAVQEQLGLRLAAQTVPIEVIVVESAEKPRWDDLAAGSVRPISIPARATARLVSSTSEAQSEAASLPRFEVVSIKMNKAGQPGLMGCHGTDRGPQNVPLGRCVFTNVTALSLFGAAFNQETYRTAKLPDWFSNDRFDLETKADPPVTQNELALMFRAMFYDRFNLAFHEETKEVSGFALVVARSGPRLEKAENQDSLTDKEQNTTIAVLDELTSRPINPAAASSNRMAMLSTQKSTLPWLANIISRSGILDGIVADKTGLAGYYKFQLHWQPEGKLMSTPTDRVGPSFVTAMEEQLGLSIKPEKIQIRQMVIDRLDRPTTN